MIYPQIFAEQFCFEDKNPLHLKSPTRSPEIIKPFHTAIAKQIENNFGLQTQSLANGKEYTFTGLYGSKKTDIAIFYKNSFKGAILFKGIRSSYNKNSNNYIETMRGESSLFLDVNIPIYQVCFIPEKIRIKNNDFETPSVSSFNSIEKFISFSNENDYWKKLKMGYYYITVDYSSYKGTYSAKKVKGVEETLTEGINNFVEKEVLKWKK